jgi:hypothetical protein
MVVSSTLSTCGAGDARPFESWQMEGGVWRMRICGPGQVQRETCEGADRINGVEMENGEVENGDARVP